MGSIEVEKFNNIEWQEHKIRFEQRLCEAEGVFKDFRELLLDLNIASKQYHWNTASCFIVYAWPHEQFPEEKWIQPFLSSLHRHITEAGIETKLDRKNNRIGGSVYGFIEEVQKATRAIIVGSRSLLLKHKEGRSNVCSELNVIRRKNNKNLFPILLCAEIPECFPPWFEGYTNIVDWRNESYFNNLKDLMRGLFQLDFNNAEYNQIWQKFEQKHLSLVNGLPKKVVEKLIQEEKLKQEELANETYKNYFAKFVHVLSSKHHNSIYSVLKQFLGDLSLFKKISLAGLCIFIFFALNLIFFIRIGEKASIIKVITNDNKEVIPEIIKPLRRNTVSLISDKIKTISSPLLFIAITGFPGTGKTVVAQTYSNEYLNLHSKRANSLRWYIRSENEYFRHEDYINLAKKLGINCEHSQDLQYIINKVNQALVKYPNFILIFDNVHDFKNIEALVPNSSDLKGQVIITSRISDILPPEQHMNGFSISLNDGMTKEEAIELFQKISQQIKTEEVKILINRFGTLPLAIVQIARYMERTHIQYMDLISFYDNEYIKPYLQEPLPVTYQLVNEGKRSTLKDEHAASKTYTTIIRLAISKLSENAQGILYLSSYLYPDSIPIELFYQLNLPLEKLKEAINELASNSLINLNTKNKCFSIHRVIQDITKNLIQEKNIVDNQKQRCIEKVLSLIHFLHRLNVTSEHDYYSKLFLIPHLETVLNQEAKNIPISQGKAQGMIDLGLLYKALGHAKRAADYYNTILRLNVPLSNDLYFELLTGLGRAYQGYGDFIEAQAAYNKAYLLYQKLENKSPALEASALNNLSLINKDIGSQLKTTDYEKSQTEFQLALKYQIKAVEISRNFAGQERNQIRYLSNLGEIYRELGRLEDAEKNILEALKLCKTVFPKEEHRVVASTYFNLGKLYLDFKKYELAKLQFESAVRISSLDNVAGKNHPLTARHLDGLGLALNKLGERSKGCQCFKEAQQILEQNQLGQKQLKKEIEAHNKLCSPAI